MKQAGVKGDSTDEKLDILPDEGLFATPSGVLKSGAAKRVFEFTAEKATKLADKRPELKPAALRAKLADVLNVNAAAHPPRYRALYFYGSKHIAKHDFKQGEFAVETEAGIQAIVGVYGKTGSMMVPPTGKVNVYLGHISGQDDVANIPAIAKIAASETPLAVVDPSGIGLSMAKSCGDRQFFHAYGADYMYAATGDMLGRSYLGRRVSDVLRVLDFLYANGAEDVTLIGRGLNSITAAFAGLLHEHDPKVRLLNYLPSYHEIIDSPIHKWPASSFPRGILKFCDLPDVYAAIGKRLSLKSPWNEMMNPAR